MFYLRAVAGALGFAAAILYGIGLAIVRRDRSRVLRDASRAIARLTRRPLGIRVVVRGEERLHSTRPCIFIANHQSALDIPILAGIYPEDTILIAKKEVLSCPLLGWFFAASGNVPIDRSSPRRAVATLQRVEEAVRSHGLSVWIFPEGTWGKEPGRLLPFKKGAFRMAIATGAPLVPIVVAPLAPTFDLAARRLGPGTVEVRVLDPIPVAGLTEEDVDALAARAQSRMAAALRELGGARRSA
jgi:1-acyl-sn-glycerol-3-phosphate acyltransferase